MLNSFVPFPHLSGNNSQGFVRRSGVVVDFLLKYFRHYKVRWTLDISQVCYETILGYLVILEILRTFYNVAFSTELDITPPYSRTLIIFIKIYLVFLCIRIVYNISYCLLRTAKDFLWINVNTRHMTGEYQKHRYLLWMINGIRLFISGDTYVLMFVVWIMLRISIPPSSLLDENNSMLMGILIPESIVLFLRCVLYFYFRYYFRGVSWFLPFMPVTPLLNIDILTSQETSKEDEDKKQKEVVLKSLKVVRFEEKQDDNEIQCAICLSLIRTNEKVIVLQCQHSFHPKCIKAWLWKKLTCPTCRVKIQEVVPKKKKKSRGGASIITTTKTTTITTTKTKQQIELISSV